MGMKSDHRRDVHSNQMLCGQVRGAPVHSCGLPTFELVATSVAWPARRIIAEASAGAPYKHSGSKVYSPLGSFTYTFPATVGFAVTKS